MAKSRRRAKGGGAPQQEGSFYQPRPETLRAEEYAYNPFMDWIAAIPLVNIIFPYIVIPLLTWVDRLCTWLLDHWRSFPQAVAEFRALPRRSIARRGMSFHLHVFMRQALGNDNWVYCIGLDVATRRVVFLQQVSKTTEEANASHFVPQIIKELCQSIVRENYDDPSFGKPSLITTHDYVLYFEFVKFFQKSDITLLCKADSEIMLGRPSDDTPVPLSAVTDALVSTLDRDATLMLAGQDLPPSVAESFRPAKSKPSRSTVKHLQVDGGVPPVVEFCASCHKLFYHKELKSCSRCGFPEYCSKDCQTLDWKRQHSKVCKHLQLVKDQGGFL